MSAPRSRLDIGLRWLAIALAVVLGAMGIAALEVVLSGSSHVDPSVRLTPRAAAFERWTPFLICVSLSIAFAQVALLLGAKRCSNASLSLPDGWTRGLVTGGFVATMSIVVWGMSLRFEPPAPAPQPGEGKELVFNTLYASLQLFEASEFVIMLAWVVAAHSVVVLHPGIDRGADERNVRRHFVRGTFALFAVGSLAAAAYVAFVILPGVGEVWAMFFAMPIWLELNFVGVFGAVSSALCFATGILLAGRLGFGRKRDMRQAIETLLWLGLVLGVTAAAVAGIVAIDKLLATGESAFGDAGFGISSVTPSARTRLLLVATGVLTALVSHASLRDVPRRTSLEPVGRVDIDDDPS